MSVGLLVVITVTIQISGITGGTDASNIDLIKWFYDNGTQI